MGLRELPVERPGGWPHLVSAATMTRFLQQMVGSRGHSAVHRHFHLKG